MVNAETPDNTELLHDLLKWRWAGPWFRTFPQEEPSLHQHFLRLETLGAVTSIGAKSNSHTWLIDYRKVEELLPSQ